MKLGPIKRLQKEKKILIQHQIKLFINENMFKIARINLKRNSILAKDKTLINKYLNSAPPKRDIILYMSQPQAL